PEGVAVLRLRRPEQGTRQGDGRGRVRGERVHDRKGNALRGSRRVSERDPDLPERQETVRAGGVPPRLLPGPARLLGDAQGGQERGRPEGRPEQPEGAV